MKKLLAILLAAVFVSVTGCASSLDLGGGKYEVALITDVGTIDDHSFNQGAWEGMAAYCDEHDIAYKYYQPAEKTDTAYLDSMKEAVGGGAKLIICPGFLFESAVYTAQSLYPDVSFILLDGVPHSADYKETGPADNVYSVQFAEDQAGFLAGYSAVKDGYTALGFVGGMSIPSVIRFGYGFVMGAEYAAEEDGIEELSIKYHYTGDFDDTPETRILSSSWYESGTEIIFACGGSVSKSVLASAEANGGKIIGVDVDQSSQSESVVTSAMKMLSDSIYDGLDSFYSGNFKGGQSVTLDAASDGVGLPMDTSRFTSFTKAQYDVIYQKLVNGDIPRIYDSDYPTASDLPLSAVKLIIFK